MPKITKIARKKRDASRVSVFIDEEFAFGIDENMLFGLRLRVDEELSPEHMAELEQGALLSSAKSIAQRYLGRSMRTAREVQTRLKEKGIPEKTVKKTVVWLQEYGMLNDEEYTRAFIRTRLQLRPASKNRLRQDLLKKGVPAQIADPILAETVDSDADSATAIDLARTYVSKNSHIDRDKLKNRLAGYLQRRGFRMGDIFRAIDEALGPAVDDF